MTEGQKFSKGKVPVHTFLMQFKDAIIEVAKCSQAGHNKYPNDIDWQNFKRVDNPEFEYKNAACRHLLEGDSINKDMLEYGTITHEAQVIWNLLASLQVKLESNKEQEIQKALKEFNLKELIKEYSNDLELGQKIRELVK